MNQKYEKWANVNGTQGKKGSEWDSNPRQHSTTWAPINWQDFNSKKLMENPTLLAAEHNTKFTS